MFLRIANLAATMAACAVVAAAPGNDSLDLYWVDVEGGAATLIVTPAGESLLIDSGNPGNRDPRRIAKVATEIAGLSRIDHLVTTHFHIDHFGGAADLAKLIPIGAVYDNGIPAANPDNPNDPAGFERVIRPYREMKAGKRVVLKPGDEIPLKASRSGPSPQVRCLGGMQRFVAGKAAGANCEQVREKPKDTSDNANSLVLHLKFGAFDLFDGGDLTWNTEARLVCPRSIVEPVDVYDVNHHGLDVSNNPLLVRALAPTVAIMSNGATKGCEPETFATLRSVPSVQAIYQIHRNLRPDSQNNTEPERIANLERDCAANFIKVSVNPSGTVYTVSIPGKEHDQTFQAR